MPLTTALKGWDDERLIKAQDTTDLEYATQLNQVIFQATWHCDPSDQTTGLLGLLVRVWYIFDVDFKNSLKRQGLLTLQGGHYRCGFCHQNASLLATALQKRNINASILELQGHVVTRVRLPSGVYLFDPDLGAGPFQVLAGPDPAALTLEKVQQPYLKAGLTKQHSERIALMIMNLPNHRPYEGRDYSRWQTQFIEPQERGIALAKKIEGYLFWVLRIAFILSTCTSLLYLVRKAEFSNFLKSAGNLE